VAGGRGADDGQTIDQLVLLALLGCLREQQMTVGMYADVLDFARRHSRCDINETDPQGNRYSQMTI
jgi:hypothetical protein